MQHDWFMTNRSLNCVKITCICADSRAKRGYIEHNIYFNARWLPKAADSRPYII